VKMIKIQILYFFYEQKKFLELNGL